MRPLRGQLEHATLSVVERLRLEGGSSIFWLDTSGGLDTDVDLEGRAAEQDFDMDENRPSKEWPLTERGNQRIAILLHMHLCRQIPRSRFGDVCLRPTNIYHGKAFDPGARYSDDVVVDGKDGNLKMLSDFEFKA